MKILEKEQYIHNTRVLEYFKTWASTFLKYSEVIAYESSFPAKNEQ